MQAFSKLMCISGKTKAGSYETGIGKNYMSEKNHIFLISAELTDIGRKRHNNEDAILSLPEHGVFCVADGMGGAEEGEFASQAVIEAIENEFAKAESNLELAQSAELIRRAISSAAQRVKQRAVARGVVGTGTTAAILLISKTPSPCGLAMHAGDSRIYLFRNSILKQLTRDHSMANYFGLDDDSAIPPSLRNIITKAIGVDLSVKLDEMLLDIHPGDLYLVCSDGLTRMVADTQIAELFISEGDSNLDTLCKKLVLLANEAGGDDNISVILVRVVSALQVSKEKEGIQKIKKVSESVSEVEKTVSAKKRKKRRRIVSILSTLIVTLPLLFFCYSYRLSGLDFHFTRIRNSKAKNVSVTDYETWIRNAITQTLMTGRWGEFKKRISLSPEIQVALENDAVNSQIFDKWTTTWKKASLSPEECQLNYEELVLATHDTLRRAGLQVVPLPETHWNGTPMHIANIYCERIYSLQRYFIQQLNQEVEQNIEHMNVFASDPHNQTLKVWATTRVQTSVDAESVANIIVSTRKAISRLKKYLDTLGPGPISVQEVRACPAHILPQIAHDSRSVWEQLWLIVTGFDGSTTWRVLASKEPVTSRLEVVNKLQKRILNEINRNKWNKEQWFSSPPFADIRLFLMEMENLYDALQSVSNTG